MPAGRFDKTTVAWYGDMSFLPSLWRVMGCGGVRCDIYYGEPIPVVGAVSRKVLARQTEQAMRALQQRARAASPDRAIAKARQAPQ
jgi:1-acyl-sn-glycerol-3-phosphate acyltransferase